MAKVVEAQPQLQFVIAEGDYYRAASMTKQANEADQLVDAIAALNRASGVNIDLELSLYDADHRPNAALVASTKRALAERPSTTGHHAMAWVLHRAGRDREASAEMAKVITVGDRDPVIRFHAAVIADAVGDVDEARRQIDLVLAGNPRASGINPVALTTLAGRLGRRIPAPR